MRLTVHLQQAAALGGGSYDLFEIHVVWWPLFDQTVAGMGEDVEIAVVHAAQDAFGLLAAGQVQGVVNCYLPYAANRLKEEPGLVGHSMEESLRRDGPPQRLFRVATRDIELGGAQIRAGDWVALFYAAANRDPAAFSDPDDFVLKRPNVNRHLTFGHGIHHCLGSRIARLEAQKLIEGLLANFRRLEPAGAAPVRQRGGLLNYGLESCPVTLVQ